MGTICSCPDFKENQELNTLKTEKSREPIKQARSAETANESILPELVMIKDPLPIIRIQSCMRGMILRKKRRATKLVFNDKQRMISSTFETNFSFTDKHIIVKYKINAE